MAQASEPVVERVDARILRTRESLRAAVLDLVAERDWSDISVADLTRRARVSRPTFYLHYSSLDELAAEALIERMRASTGGAPATTTGDRAVPEWLTAFLAEVNSDRVVYRRLVGARGVAEVTRDLVADQLAERILRTRDVAPGAEEFAQFLAGGILGFLAYWLRSDRVESPDAVVATAQRLWEMIRGMFA